MLETSGSSEIVAAAAAAAASAIASAASACCSSSGWHACLHPFAEVSLPASAASQQV